MKFAAAAVLMLAFASPATAQFFSGEELKKMCAHPSDSGIAYAVGAVDAAHFYQRLAGVKDRICLPAGAKTDQVFDVACKYLDDHPEHRHWIAADLVAESAAQAWPCK